MKYRETAGKVAGALSFVLSDETRDRYGDVILARGWDLANFQRNPIALFGHDARFPIGRWRNARVDGERLVADLEPAAAGTSPRIDEIISLIRQDILPATSVGFRPIKSEPLDPDYPHRGLRYLESELLEASIVAVPANPSALQLARDLNLSTETIRLVFGESADGAPGGRSGELADTNRAPATRAPPQRNHPMNIRHQIEDAQTRLNAARDGLTAYLETSDQDAAQRDAMAADVQAIERDLRSFENAERALAPRTPAPGSPTIAAPAVFPARRPLGIPVKDVEPVDYMFRGLSAMVRAEILHKPIEDVLRHYYPDDEGTAVVTRTAIAGATTTGTGWAIDLVQLAVSQFLDLLYPDSVFPRLSALGTALEFGPNAGAIKIPSRAPTPSIGGTFVAEAAPIPVRRLGTTSITLYPHKVAGISVYSREVAQYSNPSIEALIRDSIVNDTSINVDGLLLDNAAVSTIRPAGLTNGVSTLTATAGANYAAFLGDLNKLTMPFYAANAGRRIALLMNPAQRQQLVFAPGPTGVPFGWSEQFTSMFEVVSSTSIAAGSVYAIDTVDFVSVSGAPEFEVSETATIHMEDTTPLNIASGAQGSGVLATPTQSMFQTAQIAIRMIAPVSWAMRRAGMVQFIGTGVAWGP